MALTSNVMKCFEKFVISLLEKEVQPLLDTCQFAYTQNRGTEDAALSIVHLVSVTVQGAFSAPPVILLC